MLETRYQEEVIAFFSVIGMCHLTFVFPSSYHSQRLFVITSGFAHFFVANLFFFFLCGQTVVVKFRTRISAFDSGCSRAVCLICLDILFKRIKELYVGLIWRITSFLYFMAWYIRGFKLLPVLISVDHFSILVEALQLLSVLTDHPWQQNTSFLHF